MRIMLADNQSRVRHALTVLLQEQPGWLVVGVASNLDNLIAQFPSIHPDLLILDSRLSGMRVGVLKSHIRDKHPSIKIIALVNPAEIDAGCDQEDVDLFVQKVDPPDKLLEAIRSLVT